MKLTIPTLDICLDQGFSQEVDIFNRANFGESLLNIIKNNEDGTVIALDSPWGEGKSTFAKMWHGLLKQHEIPCIYFDAFENDYQTDPFLAISRQIYELTKENGSDRIDEFKDKVISVTKILARSAARIGTRAITGGIVDETFLEGTGSEGEAASTLNEFLDKQITKSGQDKRIINDFRFFLEELANETSNTGKLVIIIDELDRCKPLFALEILEKIKHFFSSKGITFFLIMNRKQLEESVKSEYGSGIDSERYLQKFITLWCSLPKTRGDIGSTIETYINKCLKDMDFRLNRSDNRNISELITYLAKHFNLSLREIEKTLTNFSIIYNASGESLSFQYQWLGVFLSILKVIKPNVYFQLTSETMPYQDLVEITNIDQLEFNNWKYAEKHPLQWLLKYYLGTKEEKDLLLEQGNIISNPYETHQNALILICTWLDHLKVN